MHEIKTVKLHALSTALSPLTHMQGNQGNEAVINRTRVMYVGRVCEVPALSGNAIRHKMVREPGANFLVMECGLYGKLNIDQANFLFYGGSLTESAISDNLGKIAAMQELLPLYRLLGGSLKNQVLAGSLLVGMGTLICEENRDVLEKSLPEELIYGMPELRSCEDYVSGYQYTRGDAAKRPDLLATDICDADGREKSNQMIYAGQHVIPGAVFYHRFILQNVNRIEVGALYAALLDWGANDGTMGGSGRIGHGSIKTEIYADGTNFFGDELDLKAYADEYREYVRDHKNGIIAWLNEAFPVYDRAAKAKAKPAGKTGRKTGDPVNTQSDAAFDTSADLSMEKFASQMDFFDAADSLPDADTEA